MTLIELLVVIVILTTVVAAAIPIVSPTNDGRRLREATRGLNTYIFGAQTRAIALNRPYGIAIKRLSQDTNPDLKNKPEHEDNALALEVFYVEQQPPYSGFDPGAAVRVGLYNPPNPNWYNGARPLVLVQFVVQGNANLQGVDGLPPSWDADSLPTKTIRPGDIIELNGTRYELLADPRDTSIEARLDETNTFFAPDTGKASSDKVSQIVARPLNNTGQMIDVKYDEFGNELGSPGASGSYFFTNPATYKVLRQPVATSDPPYQLPEGTAIDLRASGVGIDDYFYVAGLHDNPQGILIMFAPEGRISRVSFGQMPYSAANFDEPVVDNVYLMVGRRENAPPPAFGSDPTLDGNVLKGKTEEEIEELKKTVNWLMGESRWIAIGAQSGRIVTVENAFVNPLTVAEQSIATVVPSEQLRNEQIQKARQFTREMSQLGGR